MEQPTEGNEDVTPAQAWPAHKKKNKQFAQQQIEGNVGCQGFIGESGAGACDRKDGEQAEQSGRTEMGAFQTTSDRGWFVFDLFLFTTRQYLFCLNCRCFFFSLLFISSLSFSLFICLRSYLALFCSSFGFLYPTGVYHIC